MTLPARPGSPCLSDFAAGVARRAGRSHRRKIGAAALLAALASPLVLAQNQASDNPPKTVETPTPPAQAGAPKVAEPNKVAELPKAAEPAKAESKPDPAKAQQIATTVCAGCHGADGNSPTPANPSLAGQHPNYITKQLANFKAGERKNPIMQGMAAPLSPEDMKNLGAYFGGQKPKPGAAKDKDVVALGEKLYRGGNLTTGLPACAACHGPAGEGIPAQYPRLAGQHADYTLGQLKAFRAGERANDNAKVMRTIAAKMSDYEMKAVSEYVAGLRRANLTASR